MPALPIVITSSNASKNPASCTRKAARNRPLTGRQERANKPISTRRYIAEQCFGTTERLFGMARARYCGAHKVNAQVLLKGMYPKGINA